MLKKNPQKHVEEKKKSSLIPTYEARHFQYLYFAYVIH